MPVFYTPAVSTDQYTLNEEESKHCVRVLRQTVGDQITLVDGQGGYYLARITDANPKKCALQIVSRTADYGKRPFYVHVAVAPTKNFDRMEWFVEKAVEIGVDEISFLACERSERKSINRERLEKIAVSAMKQSLQAYLPRINDLQPFPTFVARVNPATAYMAHLAEHDRIHLSHLAPSPATCLLIGPEGDFSPAEIQLAYARGLQPVTLGAARLRTETAALVACHTIHLLHELKAAERH